jgi:serine protease inhibitor
MLFSVTCPQNGLQIYNIFLPSTIFRANILGFMKNLTLSQYRELKNDRSFVQRNSIHGTFVTDWGNIFEIYTMIPCGFYNFL